MKILMNELRFFSNILKFPFAYNHPSISYIQKIIVKVVRQECIESRRCNKVVTLEITKPCACFLLVQGAYVQQMC